MRALLYLLGFLAGMTGGLMPLPIVTPPSDDSYYRLKDGTTVLVTLEASFREVDPLPRRNLTPVRTPGGSTLFYRGDGRPLPGLKVLEGLITADDEWALGTRRGAIRVALLTADTLERVTPDGTTTWALESEPVPGYLTDAPASSPGKAFQRRVTLYLLATQLASEPTASIPTVTLPDPVTGTPGSVTYPDPSGESPPTVTVPVHMTPGGTTDRGEWVSGTAPENYMFPAAVGHGGKLYVIGGETTPTGARVYDPSTNAWTALASLPYPLQSVESCAVASGDYVYVLGGRGASSEEGNTNLLRYSISGNSWTSLASFTTARRRCRALLSGGLIYLVGGYNGITAYRLDTVEVFDIAAGTWAAGPTMSDTRSDHAVQLDGSDVVAFNGSGSGNENAERLNPATGYWIANDVSLPGPGLYGGVFGTTASGFVVAGGTYFGQDSSAKGTVQTSLLDADTGQWTPMASAPLRIDEFASGAVVSDVLYVVQQYDFLAFAPPGVTAPTL
jgi:hypothetical protein